MGNTNQQPTGLNLNLGAIEGVAKSVNGGIDPLAKLKAPQAQNTPVSGAPQPSTDSSVPTRNGPTSGKSSPCYP